MNKFRRMFGFLFVLMFILSMGTSANAEENSIIESSVIPDSMQPYTEIQYVGNSCFKVLKGGVSVGVNKQEKLLEKESFAEASELEKDCKENGTADTAIKEAYPDPQTGMKIVYGSDGLLTEILNADGTEYMTDTQSFTGVKKAATSAKTTATKKKIASWGANNNRLYLKTKADGTKKIIGYGRATTFNDEIGQRDNTLVKGDVATKKAYDNCKYGITVKVTAKKKNSSTKLAVKMKKRDVGGMPNAIVDIWKTGVEYWGYTYSSSFSMPGEVKIVHANSY